MLDRKDITSTWREIVYPVGETISQDSRYKSKGNLSDMYQM